RIAQWHSARNGELSSAEASQGRRRQWGGRWRDRRGAPYREQLIVRGATLGLMPDVVMEMTLRERSLYGEGRARVKREAFQQAIAVAHLSENLARSKRVPPLAEIVQALGAVEPQTPKQKRASFLARMDAMVDATTKKFGGAKKKAK